MVSKYNETIVFRTTKEQKEYINKEVKRLETEYGPGFTFSESDVIRRCLYKAERGNQ